MKSTVDSARASGTGLLFEIATPWLDCRIVRRPADGSVKHCIGQMMKHARYHYLGLIFGASIARALSYHCIRAFMQVLVLVASLAITSVPSNIECAFQNMP